MGYIGSFGGDGVGEASEVAARCTAVTVTGGEVGGDEIRRGGGGATTNLNTFTLGAVVALGSDFK